MASGRLINDGQVWIVDQIAAKANVSGLYVGLMTDHNTPTPWSAQLPTDIEEISSASGYYRQLASTWTVTSGVDPYVTGDQVTFNVSGTWSDVYGYFVCETSGGNDALWTELFPAAYGGDKVNGDTLLITPKLEIKDENES